MLPPEFALNSTTWHAQTTRPCAPVLHSAKSAWIRSRRSQNTIPPYSRRPPHWVSSSSCFAGFVLYTSYRYRPIAANVAPKMLIPKLFTNPFPVRVHLTLRFSSRGDQCLVRFTCIRPHVSQPSDVSPPVPAPAIMWLQSYLRNYFSPQNETIALSQKDPDHMTRKWGLTSR